MKVALIAGWVLLAVEIGIVSLMATGHDGGDAAGQGMAKGFAMLAAPFLVVAAGLLLWGQLTGHPWGVWGGTGIVGVPCAVAVALLLPNLVPNFGRILYQAQAGSFADSRLTRIADAIRKDDFARERELLQAGPVDWSAQDRHGKTLLDIALEHKRAEGLRILLEAGARPNDRHMVYAMGTEATSLEVLLAGGGNWNAVDEDGTPLAFLGYVTPEKLEILIRHGLDVNATDPAPARDRRSLLIHHIEAGQWDVARLLVERGANLNYRTPGGVTAMAMLERQDNAFARRFAAEVGIVR